MSKRIDNLVFEGGGVLGISYLGVLQYLYENNLMANISHVAGTSAGAIIACLTSFNLPFNELMEIADTLDYKKILSRDPSHEIPIEPEYIDSKLHKLSVDLDCLFRLVKNYGWYSSRYFYEWIKEKIESQFDKSKKLPPYTFDDFRNPELHLGGRHFFDLSVIGTDISNRNSKVFSYDTTPLMEVATAVRISMSIPFFFEAISQEEDGVPKIYSDGGVLRNYPISLFDEDGIPNPFTLGACFKVHESYHKIDNLLEFITNFFMTYHQIQQVNYMNNPEDIARSIEIDTGDVSFVDFNITPGDNTYIFLYIEGYESAKTYFTESNPS